MSVRFLTKWKGHERAFQTIARQYGLDIHNVFAHTLNSIWRNGGQRQRLGLAISGGVDSMALAKLCSDVVNRDSSAMAPLFALNSYPRTDTSFTAFIVNHKLRENSGAEALRVAEELAKLNIESEILELDWNDHGDPDLLNNVETIARTLRYQALGRACANRKIKQLLLGHHADDQAETVMTRILNNYVGSGLGGMHQMAPIPECGGIYGVDQSGSEEQQGDGNTGDTVLTMMGEGIAVGRPLLKFWKRQLTQLCTQSKVQWFEDHTNADRALTLRNTVRFLQEDGVLPTALRSPRLWTMARNVGERRDENEKFSERIFACTRLILDLKSGELRFFLPQRPRPDTITTAGVQSYILRKIIQLVAPKNLISLQELHFAADFVFGNDAKEDMFGGGAEKYQVAGVSIQRNTDTRNKTLGAGELVIHRAIPRAFERRNLQVTLWPSATSTYKHGGISSSTWRLWDGRYWICVSPPNPNPNPYTTVIARFLDKHDLANLRKSITENEKRTLEKALAKVKGDIRFTLPSIVAKQRSMLDDKDSITEKVVAIPSLNWSVFGWKRGFEPSNDSAWRWDIRYKYVELHLEGRHSVVS